MSKSNASFALLSFGGLLLLGAGCGSADVPNSSSAEPVAAIRAGVVACQDDAFEPNQSAVTATALPFGVQRNAVSCPQNVDFYSFQGPAAGTPFTVSLVFQSDDFDFGTDTGDLNALLRDQAGNLLFIGDRVAKDNEFLPAVSDGGVYSLEIQSAQRPVPYTVAVTAGTLRCGILDDALEPNETIRSASPLGAAAVTAYICRGDSDFYRVQGPPAGQLLAVDLSYTPARGTLGIRLFDRDGVPVAPGFFSGDPTITRRVNSDGGVYFAEVFGDGKQSGSYTIQARTETTNCGALEDSFEPNDTALTATPLGFPSSTNAFMCQGGRDFYRFTGPPVGAAFNLDVEPNSTILLEITDSDGHRLLEDGFFRGGIVRLVSNGRQYSVGIGNVPRFDPTDAQYNISLQLPEPNTACDLKRDLESLGQACKVANAGPIDAINLSAESPTLVSDRSYVLKLKASIDPSDGSTVYGGTTLFTAPETASYALFTGSPGIPLTLTLTDDGTAVPFACSSSFGISECNKLLRGSRFELEAGHTYTLTAGPAHAPSTPSLRIGWQRVADFAEPPQCQTLRNVASTCGTAEAGIRTVPAAAGATPAPTLEENTSYGVRLPSSGAENAGAVAFTPALSGQYVMYLGTPGIPFRVLDGTSEVSASCIQRLPTATCSNLREAVAYDLSAGHSYRLEFGPTSPQSYIRFMLQPNIPVVGECNLSELSSLAAICGADPHALPVQDVSDGSRPFLQSGQGVNVKLQPIEGAFRGALDYFASQNNRFALYLGSAAVPVSLTDNSQAAHYMTPLCSARLPSSTCPGYKVVYLYEGNQFAVSDIDLGPSNPQQWVRTAVASEPTPAP